MGILNKSDCFITVLCAWVKVFRIITEFRVLRLDFPSKVSLKLMNYANYTSFSPLLTVCLNTIDFLYLTLLIFC